MRLTLLLLTVLGFGNLQIFAQMPATDTIIQAAPLPKMDEVDVPPKYRSGETALANYLAAVDYPKKALKNKVQGTVIVGFYVLSNGTVMWVNVKTSSGDKNLDEAAVQHIEKMPPWKPGRDGGKVVDVECWIPVKFVIKE